jgi:hypothetical protein
VIAQVTVTPTNGDQQIFECSVDTPVVGLGALHQDHSADNQRELDDSLKELYSTPKTQALAITEAKNKRKHFQELCLF